MTRIHWILSVLAVLGMGRWTTTALAQQASGDLAVLQVRPSVYMITGAGGNIAVQIGPAGAILVDSGATRMSDQVLAAINRLTGEPIRYIFNTSADADHVGGNEKLSKAGRTILAGNTGNAAISEEVLNNNGAASVLASENVLTRMSAPKGGVPSVLWPTKTYSGHAYPMYLNGEGIQLFHLAAAHTDGDSIVFFRRNDVIATGDIFDTTRFPIVDVANGGTIQGEIDALNRIIDLVIPPFPLIWQEDRTLLIPGHGRISDHSDLVDYRDMVTIVRDRVEDLVRKGMTLEQVKAANPTLGFRARYGSDSGPWTTDMFVEAVYRSLKSEGKSLK